MSNDHTYSLPLKWVGRKYKCPQCGQYSFRPYRDNGGAGQDFGELFKDHEDPNVRNLALTVGKCDHERQCGHHFPPKQFFSQVKVGNFQTPKYEPKEIKTAKPLKRELLLQCMPKYKENRSHFEKYLMSVFEGEVLEGWETTREAYKVGATKDGRIIYWLIGTDDKVRDGKVMAYKPDGHRDKTQNPRWIREMQLKSIFPNYNKKDHPDEKNYKEMADMLVLRPYFGTHLLMDVRRQDLPVALVEGEKSALICATLLPNYIWLAIGTKKFDPSKLAKVMYQQRELYLFPDYDGIEEWREALPLLGYSRIHFKGELIDRLHETDNDDIGDILLRWYIRFKEGKVEDTVQLLTSLGEEELASFADQNKLAIEPGTIIEPFDDEWLERELKRQQ